jgi:hypothetical protein
VADRSGGEDALRKEVEKPGGCAFLIESPLAMAGDLDRRE